MSLEQFRPVCQGRKWEQHARSLEGFLSRLAGYANPDGTFINNGIDYSPSYKKLREKVSKRSFERWSDELRTLGFISWQRDKRKLERRSYTLHMDKIRGEQVPDSPVEQVPYSEKQVPDWQKAGATKAQKQVPDWQKAGATRDPIPSLPSKDPSTYPSAEKILAAVVGVFADGGYGILSPVGIDRVMTAAQECDDQEIQDRFKAWLRRRDITGLTHPLPMFAKEFAQAGIQAALDRPEYTPAQMAEINREIDEQIAKRQAREAEEEAKRRAEEEWQAAHVDELFGPPAPVGVH
jgi:hypothetical protein